MPGNIDGIDILRASITLPRIGVWWADVELDTSESIIGNVEIRYENWSLAGTIASGGESVFGRTRMRIVGGRGCLGLNVSAKAYRGVPMRIPIVDSATEAGETVSPTARWGLSILLTSWLRIQSPASQAIGMLARKGGFAWRFLPDGTFWFGDDPWNETTIDHETMNRIPAEDAVFIATDDLILPGSVFLGRRVERVEMTPHESRSKVWFQP